MAVTITGLKTGGDPVLLLSMLTMPPVAWCTCCLWNLNPQIEDSEHSRRAIGKYIEVWHYTDEHKELRLNDVLLPYSTFDLLSEVDPVAIIDNKRLGHVLEVARQVQRKRDNNRSLK